MYLTSRERKIIEFLAQEQGVVSVKEIATVLDVSERTIHRDLKNIVEVLSDYQLEISKKSGAGIKLSGSIEAKHKLLKAIAGLPLIEFTPEERRAIILSTLLEAKEPIKLFTLANELFVTIATISHDLDQIELELKEYNLELIRKRGYGVEIIGEEIKKRAVLSQIITKYVEPFTIVSLGNKTEASNRNTPSEYISARLLESIDMKNILVIQSVVEKAIKKLPHELADNSYIGLVVHLALAIERLQKGEQITFGSDYLQQIVQTKEYAIAKRIIQDLKLTLSMNIPEDEIGYITMHLMGAKLQLNQDFFIEDSSMDIAIKAAELIQYIEVQLELSLSENTSLLKDLVAHLKPAIYRLKQGMPIKNPLLDVIKRDYQELFWLIEQGVKDTFSELVFPKAEIGYLVLHFAAALLDKSDTPIRSLVICSSGIGTAKMLATKLLQKVPEIKQVDHKSLFDIDELNLEEYDLIISTIPLMDIGRDYIVASPMLTEREIQQIQKTIRTRKIQSSKPKDYPLTKTSNRAGQYNFIHQLKATQIYSNMIIALLEDFQVQRIEENLHMEGVLLNICKQLEGLHIVQHASSVHRQLLKREEIGGLGIPGTTLALYHARSKEVLRPCFHVYPLKQSKRIKGMDGEQVVVNTVLLMLAPENTSNEVLEILSFISNLIIQRDENSRLFESGNEEKIREFLIEQFQKFFKEKNLL
ncbi:BglG family transcription antiterminator [Ornithinibacillus bavariensis]|uniref:Transcriptional regulator MtlR n=1 Tax=Ornithinibacillus bavariensis TaxID=545502 RepID=A0A920C7U3_9BACI|nr:BglG family transcription antiterminator [Ornithinibacillus bavariensis]GIO27027.1 transcriptional regulator MtlR [Ornithinibacillus bavariensis]